MTDPAPGPGPAGVRPATASSLTRAATTIVALAPVGLVVVAEAAWISVVGGLLQEFAFREPVLGIPAFVAFVVAGIVTARLVGRRLGDRWPVVALGLVVAAGALGWLASSIGSASLGDGPAAAVAANPGGWIAGLALLRGFAHARLPLLEGSIARLLGLGVPGLAISAIVGGVIGEPFRGRFLADALGASIVFIIAATLALAFTRLSAIGGDAGFDWRRNPTWLGLTVGLLVLAVAAAVPLSVVAGTLIAAALTIALLPMLLIGLLLGFDRKVWRILALTLIVGVIPVILIRIFGGNPQTPAQPPAVATDQGQRSVVEQLLAMGFGWLLLVVGVVGILILAALWLDRARPPSEDPVDEVRTIDRGGGEVAPVKRGRRFGRRSDPVSAADAYVALVRDLDGHADVRRLAGETPAEHAARLRSVGQAAFSLDLLAADYALARYGDVDLPAREDRRAVGRWRSLRRTLVRTNRGG
jgi:hypothetical protein